MASAVGQEVFQEHVDTGVVDLWWWSGGWLCGRGHLIKNVHTVIKEEIKEDRFICAKKCTLTTFNHNAEESNLSLI